MAIVVLFRQHVNSVDFSRTVTGSVVWEVNPQHSARTL